MQLYLAQDNVGNVFLVDDLEKLPKNVEDMGMVYLAEKAEHIANDPTLTIEIQDYSEIVSLERGGKCA